MRVPVPRDPTAKLSALPSLMELIGELRAQAVELQRVAQVVNGHLEVPGNVRAVVVEQTFDASNTSRSFQHGLSVPVPSSGSNVLWIVVGMDHSPTVGRVHVFRDPTDPIDENSITLRVDVSGTLGTVTVRVLFLPSQG